MGRNISEAFSNFETCLIVENMFHNLKQILDHFMDHFILASEFMKHFMASEKLG